MPARRNPLVLALAILAIAAGVITTALIWRGFRATTEPSALETAVARAVRDLAIPRRASALVNPLPATEGNLREGHDVFLSRCAGCHGPDGSGVTPVGRNLSPRASDLRSGRTQALTDGELHYIIENGVALTGMPGWGATREARADQIWQIVFFIRSLRPLTRAERAAQAETTASARYVGSAACAQCHRDIYDRWKTTPMANVVRDPRQHPDAIIPSLETNHVAPFAVNDVAFVYGSLWKQRYFTKLGDDYVPLPVQWEVKNRRWSRYMVPDGADWWVPFYPHDNRQRPTGPTCDGCHSVGYDIRTKRVAEWNVGCERCHGPGGDHVAHPSRANIVNPAHMDVVAENDTCIQCHSQGRPLDVPIDGRYFDWPVGYRVGLKLAEFWKLEEAVPGRTDFYYFADGTSHKNRMQGNDFVQSVMYRRGITCATCHDVHGTSNDAQLRKPANALCLDCHGPGSPNGPRTATLEQHTHHRAGSPGSDCVACHMPAIQSEGVPGSFVHAHTFRFIAPGATDRLKVPNPCTSCHTDKSTAWATAALRTWPEFSPWRVGH